MLCCKFKWIEYSETKLGALEFVCISPKLLLLLCGLQFQNQLQVPWAQMTMNAPRSIALKSRSSSDLYLVFLSGKTQKPNGTNTEAYKPLKGLEAMQSKTEFTIIELFPMGRIYHLD